jgi:molybdopterin converting factor small subunit
MNTAPNAAVSHVTVRLSTPLRKFAGGQPQVQLAAATVAQALAQLDVQYPELRGRVLGADGALREFIQVHVGKTPLRQFGGMQAALSGGELISLSSPFSGG